MYVLEWQYEGYNHHIHAEDSTVLALAKMFEDKNIRYWVVTRKGKTVKVFDWLVKEDFPGWQN